MSYVSKAKSIAGEVATITDVRSTNANATVGNITDVRATNVNSTIGNITECRATNVNGTVGSFFTSVSGGAVVATTNSNATNFNTPYATFSTAKYTMTNINGATCAQVNAIRAGWSVVGVHANITANVVGATTINIGDGTDADGFGSLAGVAANTRSTFGGAMAGTAYNANTNIVLTAVDGGADFTAGNVDVYVTYVKPISWS